MVRAFSTVHAIVRGDVVAMRADVVAAADIGIGSKFISIAMSQEIEDSMRDKIEEKRFIA